MLLYTLRGNAKIPHRLLTQSFTLQLNCSSLFYNLLSVSLCVGEEKVVPVSDPLEFKHKREQIHSGAMTHFLCLDLHANAASRVGVENEWMWRSGVDKNSRGTSGRV